MADPDFELFLAPEPEPDDERACGYWVALHRPDGSELTPDVWRDGDATFTARGYRRAPWIADIGARFPETIADWGPVAFASVWTAREGGECRSLPPLQDLRREWVKQAR